MQKMLSLVRRAVDHYHMIEEGDRIAVGVSGGKDSLTLLTALAELRRFYPKKFEVIAITLETQKLSSNWELQQLKMINFYQRITSEKCSLLLYYTHTFLTSSALIICAQFYHRTFCTK